MEEYDAVIRTQLEEDIVEEAPKTTSNKEFYIPHKGIEKESSETTKLRVVYDASAKSDSASPSLNDCLYAGPPLQNKLWDVLVQQRAFPLTVSSDIRQAFLQIRVKEEERDVLRFHWRKDEMSPLETLRFTRVLFGLAPSPYLLQGVIETHLDTWSESNPDEIEHLRKSMYVDDLLSGGTTVEQAETRKEVAKEVMQDATFELHKWSSNVPQLEDEPSVEQTYAKSQLMVKPREMKFLGLKWNKHCDTLKISFPSENGPATKRGILRKLARIYDPLGLVSPLTLEGKLVYRDVCVAKLPWDADLSTAQLGKWQAWERSLPKEILHWIVGIGSYKQFVANRVAKIQAHPTICRRHVSTKSNPADVASRGGLVSTVWWSGPERLQNPAR